MTTEYNLDSYIQDAVRTKSSGFHIDQISSEALLNTLSSLVSVGELLDMMKKVVFYGKEAPTHLRPTGEDPKLHTEKIDPDIMHAIIGHATESLEMLEALCASLVNGEPLDLVNLDEEFGDANWYQALYLYRRGRTFAEICYQNNQKLRSRYPVKFENSLSEGRDVVKEREILETYSS